jgi:glycosyltransferase involved in cell wall biosynthesis
MKQNKKVLIIGFVWPEPESSAAGSRMIQLISLFQSEDWKVTFASAAAESEYMEDLEDLGIEKVPIEVNSSEFDDFIKNLQPDVVVFDRFVTEEQFGWRVAEYCPDAVRILDTEDLHCLRRARKKVFKEGRDFSKKDLLTTEDAKREIASIYRSDLSLIISEAEMQLLHDLFDIDQNLLQYVPFLLDKIGESTIEKWPSFESRNHFVTIGNFQHEPNMNGVEYLKNEIWPRIREVLPQTELHIYGSYINSKAEQMHDPDNGFYIEGRAEEAKEVVRTAKVCLAPLRFGAGLKGKLVEAMQCGTPSVTTDIGVEGINGDLPWSGKIANDPKNFATAAVELYQDEMAWKKAQENGVHIINSRFSKQKFGRQFIDTIKDKGNNLEKYRLENFTGQMLLHHTMASTQFMSRWIEAKNKL